MKKLITLIALFSSLLTFAQTGGSPVSGSLPINENISVLIVFFTAISTALYFRNKKKSV